MEQTFVSATILLILITDPLGNIPPLLALLKNVQESRVFESENSEIWICQECGHIHVGKKAPEKCPVCDHPKAYFERRVKGY